MKTFQKIVLILLSVLLVIAFYASRHWSPIEKVLSEGVRDVASSELTQPTPDESYSRKVALNVSLSLERQSDHKPLHLPEGNGGSVLSDGYSQRQKIDVNMSLLINEMKNQHMMFQTHDEHLHRIISRKMRAKKKKPRRLSPALVKRIRNFVLFVGYPRSGHSIVGTLMDAHPHIIISNEFNLFSSFADLDKVPASRWRENLYNLLYLRSIQDVHHSRETSIKGYSLGVKNLWQGRFDRYIEVIGDKSGDVTTRSYMRNKTEFLRNYQLLKERVRVPTRVIHVLRNPFDMIATSLVLWRNNMETFRHLKLDFNSKSRPGHFKYNNSQLVDRTTEIVFQEFDTAMELIANVFGQENVLDVHNRDLVRDPEGTMSRILKFVGVRVSSQYLRVCAEKVFKSVSRSRNMVVWTPEQRRNVERKMRSYKMLSRYSFTSD